MFCVVIKNDGVRGAISPVHEMGRVRDGWATLHCPSGTFAAEGYYRFSDGRPVLTRRDSVIGDCFLGDAGETLVVVDENVKVINAFVMGAFCGGSIVRGTPNNRLRVTGAASVN